VEWIAEERVLVLDLVDLEHMGFDHDDMDGELFLHGLDDPECRRPDLIVVNFRGGGVVTPNTAEPALDRMRQATNRFIDLLRKMIGPELVEQYFGIH